MFVCVSLLTRDHRREEHCKRNESDVITRQSIQFVFAQQKSTVDDVKVSS